MQFGRFSSPSKSSLLRAFNVSDRTRPKGSKLGHGQTHSEASTDRRQSVEPEDLVDPSEQAAQTEAFCLTTASSHAGEDSQPSSRQNDQVRASPKTPGELPQTRRVQHGGGSVVLTGCQTRRRKAATHLPSGESPVESSKTTMRSNS